MSPANNCRLGKNIQAYHENLINAYDSDIGEDTRIGSFAEVGGAAIGKGCVIGAYTFISPGCKIGDSVFLGPKCALLNDLYPSIKGDDFVPNGVTIEDGAILGACVTVLPGVTIGANARVGAGAVVNKNVPPNTTVIGFPAQERDDVWQPTTLGPPIPSKKDVWHDEGGVYGPMTQESILENQREYEAYTALKKKLQEKELSLEDSMREDLMSYSPFSKENHKIDSAPAISSDHPYRKYPDRKEVFEKKYKEVVGRDESSMFGGSPYTKTTFNKEHECRGECSKSICDCDELPPAIDVTEWVGRADEPVYCRELPEGFDWEKAGIPKVTAERLRALIDADEEMVLSRTKAHKKHRIPDRLPLEGETIGLGLGYWENGQPKQGA